MISIKDTYVRQENVVVREIVGEILLIPISGKVADMERIFYFNSVGLFIWNMLDGLKNLNSMIIDVVREYEVEQQSAEKDIVELLSDLIDAGLVYKK